MQNRYIVFDVETPNSRNDRMSAIGIAVVENGLIVQEYDYLINPESRFDAFNVRLTGISPEMVADKPTFAQRWQEICPLFDSGVLVAHYAPFDISVLRSCLAAYGIRWKPYADVACTCVMGRAAYPGLPNHKLNTLSEHVGIELDHHRAGSDSRAAALLLIDYMQRGLDVKKYIRKKYL